MVKENKRPLHSQEYPTSSSFKKYVNSLISEKEIEKPTDHLKPLLPEYLTEMRVKSNPFSVIKVAKTNKLKHLKLMRKEFDKNKNQGVPTELKINRDIRNKFNASYEVRKFNYKIGMTELPADMLKLKNSKNLSHSGIVYMRSIFNRDFVVNKRRLCLLTLAINAKKEQILKLDQTTENQQQYIKEKVETLKKKRIVHEHLLRKVCQAASNAVKLLEIATNKKDTILQKVKAANYSRSYLNAECLKLEDKFVEFKTYQRFLSKCKKQQEDKVSPDRKSLLNKIKIDSFLSEMEMISYGSKSDDINMHVSILDAKNPQHNLNNSNTSGDALTKIPLVLNNNMNNKQLFKIFSKNLSVDTGHFDKLKGTVSEEHGNPTSFHSKIISDSFNLDSKNDSELLRIATLNEIDNNLEFISFTDPQKLVNVIFDLELNNLVLIENVQDQEVRIDQLTRRLESVKKQMTENMSNMNHQIRREKKLAEYVESSITCVEKSKEFFIKFNTLERYNKMCYITDLNITTIDEFFIYITEQVFLLYYSIFERNDSIENKPVEMLYRIEYMVDLFYVRLRSLDKNIIINAKKVYTQQKLEASRLADKELLEKTELLKAQKKIELSNIPPNYKFGRPVVCRSEPVKRIMETDVIDPENMKQKEENEYFFT